MAIVEMEVYSCLCSLSKFTINGINADYDDFGEKYDHDEDEADEYGCGDMRFDARPPTKEILNTYGITEEEYYEICNDLDEKLSFGYCGWCI